MVKTIETLLRWALQQSNLSVPEISRHSVPVYCMRLPIITMDIIFQRWLPVLVGPTASRSRLFYRPLAHVVRKRKTQQVKFDSA